MTQTVVNGEGQNPRKRIWTLSHYSETCATGATMLSAFKGVGSARDRLENHLVGSGPLGFLVLGVLGVRGPLKSRFNL